MTKIRKLIIKAIPVSLQHAIGGGIGIFIAYIGIKNAGLIQFTSDPGTYVLDEASGTVVASSAAVPAIVTLNTPAVWLALIGLVLTIVLLVLKVKGAILISIIATALIGIPMGLTSMANTTSFGDAINQLPTTFCCCFRKSRNGGLCSQTLPSFPWFNDYLCVQFV